MAVLTEVQARLTLTRGGLHPIYVLIGDDERGKDAFVESLCGAIDENLRGFNVQRVYANEQSLAEIVASARTLPLLGDRRIVVALRCDVFLKPRRKGGGADEDPPETGSADEEPEAGAAATGELERYVASPSPDTCLVLVAADILRTTRLAKALLKTATVVEYWGLKGDRDMKAGIQHALQVGERFVQEHAREANVRIRADAIEPLLEHAGADINVLRNDLERVITYCAGRREITVEDVHAVVGGAVQLDEWAVTRAIQFGDAPAALRHLRLGFEAGQSPWMVLGQLSWFVRSRLVQSDPTCVKGAVDSLFRTDLALKSSGGDPEVLLERLVVELCGAGNKGRRGAAPQAHRQR